MTDCSAVIWPVDSIAALPSLNSICRLCSLMAILQQSLRFAAASMLQLL